jgi:hypothetical protein
MWRMKNIPEHEVKRFIHLVKKMRDAQREYFATRSTEALKEAKRYENAVDNWISLFTEPNLFMQKIEKL